MADQNVFVGLADVLDMRCREVADLPDLFICSPFTESESQNFTVSLVPDIFIDCVAHIAVSVHKCLPKTKMPPLSPIKV